MNAILGLKKPTNPIRTSELFFYRGLQPFLLPDALGVDGVHEFSDELFRKAILRTQNYVFLYDGLESGGLHHVHISPGFVGPDPSHDVHPLAEELDDLSVERVDLGAEVSEGIRGGRLREGSRGEGQHQTGTA